jgi:hypothetical protein
MAGKADHSSTDQTGPIARRPSAGRPRSSANRPERALAAIEVGGAAQLITHEPEVVAAVTPIAPDVMPRLLQTQAAYRLLITSGFSGADAAGLIGYVSGLPACSSRWSLNQVNRLLFLRDLYTNTAWGEAERDPA